MEKISIFLFRAVNNASDALLLAWQVIGIMSPSYFPGRYGKSCQWFLLNLGGHPCITRNWLSSWIQSLYPNIIVTCVIQSRLQCMTVSIGKVIYPLALGRPDYGQPNVDLPQHADQPRTTRLLSWFYQMECLEHKHVKCILGDMGFLHNICWSNYWCKNILT